MKRFRESGNVKLVTMNELNSNYTRSSKERGLEKLAGLN